MKYYNDVVRKASERVKSCAYIRDHGNIVVCEKKGIAMKKAHAWMSCVNCEHYREGKR